MEPIEKNYNSKLIDIEKLNQISINDKIQDTNKYSNLTLVELKNLLNQNLETFEILKIKSLIKDKTINEFKRKVQSNEIIITKDNYKNYPPCILEEKKVADDLCKEAAASKVVVEPKKTNLSAALSSDFNVFNTEFSKNINVNDKSGTVINSTGKKGLSMYIDPNNNTIIISKVKEYNDFDWVALYNICGNDQGLASYPNSYIKFWWSANYETEINTNISRDKNRTYCAKYFKFDDSNGKFQIIDECILAGENVWIKLEGGINENLKLTWSNYETSSTSYVSILSKPTSEPPNSNLFNEILFQHANKDKGVLMTHIKNSGLPYYAILWGYFDDYFIKLALTKIN